MHSTDKHTVFFDQALIGSIFLFISYQLSFIGSVIYNTYFEVGGTNNNGISYDQNGNITQLDRYGRIISLPGSRYLVDRLTYSYNNTGNQLSAVADAGNTTNYTDEQGVVRPAKDIGFRDGNTSGDDYLYDANGNMIVDKNKGITSIAYNHLNLPARVDMGTNKYTEYTYDAAGTKLTKKAQEGASITYTHYIGGIQYIGSTLDFVQHSEGRYQFASGKYQYDLKDHLGNVRATVQRNTLPTTTARTYGMETSDSPLFPTNGTTTFVTSPKRSGSRSVQVGGTSSPAVSMNVAAGDVIAVSVWVTTNYNNGQVKIDYHNSSGTYISTLHTMMITTIPMGSSDAGVWYPLSKDQLVAPGSGTVRIYLQKPSSYANVFYDDLTITITGNAGIEVVQRDDYYPFGGTFNSYTSGTENLYKYNGKEEQKETGWYDYGARMQDPWLGRWNAIDPLADAYASYSPYSYVLNDPVNTIDVKGQWTVSIHSELTYRALTKVGIGGEQAKLIAHYASYYADHPSKRVQIANNIASPLWQVYRFSGVDYSGTASSQTTSWHPINEAGTFNNNIRHSMRSPEEREFGTISEEAAMKRGMKFGWDNIFASAKEGHLKDFKKNSKGIQKFGVGIHALQDAYAHKGTDMDNHSVLNDVAGDLTEARDISNSAVTVHKLISGDWGGLGNEINISMDGMSEKQRSQVLDRINEYLNSKKKDEE